MMPMCNVKTVSSAIIPVTQYSVVILVQTSMAQPFDNMGVEVLHNLYKTTSQSSDDMGWNH